LTRKVAIAGIVGVPGRYGGFETLAENLVHHHAAQPDRQQAIDLTVFCSARAYPARPARFKTARLHYVRLQANGIQSIAFDALCLWRAMRQKQEDLILLGVSGALMLPVLRLLSPMRIITNIDGIEWKREKWSPLARWVLRLSERLAVRWSHVVIADNAAIAEHVRHSYGRPCEVIAYGGDHAVSPQIPPGEEDPAPTEALADLPEAYALALCRIEPENNVEMILEAWAERGATQATAYGQLPLVFVGNWHNSAYGRALWARFAACEGLHLLPPIYEASALQALRRRARLYLHGHSAGGTNPSLVEMMHFGLPVLAHGCSFNRHSTEDQARYFTSADTLRAQVAELTVPTATRIGAAMLEIAQRRYTWDRIGAAYFALVAPADAPGDAAGAAASDAVKLDGAG
jgi:glycosyltransferase involved in cell wall biosynthesis